MATISSPAGLRIWVDNCISAAMPGIGTGILNIEKDALNGFYGEYLPLRYKRTGALGNSTRVMGLDRNSVEVGYDSSYMDYSDGEWDGNTVLEVAMTSGVPHGGYKPAGGNPVWTARAQPVWNKKKRSIVKENLIKAGLPVV